MQAPDSDPMKLQVGKSVSQDQVNGFAAQALAKQRRVENSNGHRSTSVMESDTIQPDLADEPAADLDHPGMRMIDEPLYPAQRIVSC